MSPTAQVVVPVPTGTTYACLSMPKLSDFVVFAWYYVSNAKSHPHLIQKTDK